MALILPQVIAKLFFMNRRDFIKTAGVTALLLSTPLSAQAMFGKKKSNETKTFPYSLNDTEWQEKLSPEAYRVLRKHGTERAGSSPLDHEKRTGIFHCKGCNHPLYSSAHKFDSGTGWPSFYQPLNDKAVGESTDYVLFYPRTEIYCANCGGHLGHVFKDGPKPTGLRYCMNGVAMTFVADS